MSHVMIPSDIFSYVTTVFNHIHEAIKVVEEHIDIFHNFPKKLT